MKELKKQLRNYAFTIIELMIVVAIIAVISAVAIPAYLSYVQNGYINEVTQSFSTMKSAEESFYSVNQCYVEALPNPSPIPTGGNPVTWDSYAPNPNAWAQSALAIRPNRQVRFQYEIYASNALSAGNGCGGAPTMALPTNIDCVANVANTLVPTADFGNNWYIAVAHGNLSGVANKSSTFISAIDDTAIISCNQLY